MSALTASRVRGRITTASGSDSFKCEHCFSKGERYSRVGTRVLWLLGRPAIRVCTKCERELRGVWDDAAEGA